MVLTEKDWDGFIGAAVVFLITGTFNFFRNHPHTAYLFWGIGLIILAIIYIRKYKKKRNLPDDSQ
jgi:hypothetical protein